jgi:hypothetical protein
MVYQITRTTKRRKLSAGILLETESEQRLAPSRLGK